MISPSPYAIWGPPLAAEFYVGLCRALAAPWLGPYQIPRSRAATAAAPASSETADVAAPATPAAPASEVDWQVIGGNGQADLITADRLSELRRERRQRRPG